MFVWPDRPVCPVQHGLTIDQCRAWFVKRSNSPEVSITSPKRAFRSRCRTQKSLRPARRSEKPISVPKIPIRLRLPLARTFPEFKLFDSRRPAFRSRSTNVHTVTIRDDDAIPDPGQEIFQEIVSPRIPFPSPKDRPMRRCQSAPIVANNPPKGYSSYWEPLDPNVYPNQIGKSGPSVMITGRNRKTSAAPKLDPLYVDYSCLLPRTPGCVLPANEAALYQLSEEDKLAIKRRYHKHWVTVIYSALFTGLIQKAILQCRKHRKVKRCTNTVSNVVYWKSRPKIRELQNVRKQT